MRLTKTIAFMMIAVALSTLPVRADQPFMQAAYSDLKSAQTYLKRATADKGGHRQKAIELTASALKAVSDGIAYDRRNPNNRKRNDDGLSGGYALPAGQQPNMVSAKSQLENALNNLQKASPDKGGYRTRAIDLVKAAIAETERGIEYDRRN